MLSSSEEAVMRAIDYWLIPFLSFVPLSLIIGFRVAISATDIRP